MKIQFSPVLLAFLLSILSIQLFAQSGKQYYVVIGAFRNLANAERLVAKANTQGLQATLQLNTARDLNYVFVLQTSNSKEAFARVIKVKAETEYKDAWVFSGILGNVETTPVVVEQTPEPIVTQPEPVVEQPVEVVQMPVEEPKADSVATPPVVEPAVVEKPAGKPFLFRMINEATGNEVMGEVHVLESGKATQYQSFKSNETIYLQAPKNRTATYQIVTLAPGYKEMKRTINYADPSASASETGPNQEFVISLPLVRVKVGDYIEFSNVRFFQNTAILHPDSKSELDGLAQLMNENAKYKINIHGHVNGEGNRDIVSKGNSTEFFDTNNDNLKENANAKRLSQLRADIVKEYLVSQGIDAGRIQTKGEGGKQLIYPKGSTLASRNDRVEIEIKKGR
ncbi:MAG: OmpA family protein [Bacteroidota bacterium]